jgi:hypothetical protein
MSPIPGAFAVVLSLFAIVAAVVAIRDVIRNRRLDRDIRKAFREAERLGLREKWK